MRGFDMALFSLGISRFTAQGPVSHFCFVSRHDAASLQQGQRRSCPAGPELAIEAFQRLRRFRLAQVSITVRSKADAQISVSRGEIRWQAA